MCVIRTVMTDIDPSSHIKFCYVSFSSSPCALQNDDITPKSSKVVCRRNMVENAYKQIEGVLKHCCCLSENHVKPSSDIMNLWGIFFAPVHPKTYSSFFPSWNENVDYKEANVQCLEPAAVSQKSKNVSTSNSHCYIFRAQQAQTFRSSSRSSTKCYIQRLCCRQHHFMQIHLRALDV